MAGVTSYRDKLRERLHLFHTALIGVYAEHDTACVVYAEQRQKRWYLAGWARLTLNEDDILPDKVRLLMAKNGWPLATPVSLCLTADELTVMTADFAGIEPEEMAESVYWEIRERHRDSAEKYLSVFARLPDLDNYYWVAALPQKRAEELAAGWRAAGLNLNVLTVAPPNEPDFVGDGEDTPLVWREAELYRVRTDCGDDTPGWERAVFAVLICLAPVGQNERFNFWGEISLLNRHGLVLLWLAAVMISLVLLSGWDCYRLYETKTENERLTAQLELLRDQQDEVGEIEGLWMAYRNKSRLLKELTDGRLPWHSLMVYLGTLPMDGVWLTELYLTEEGRLRLCGGAVDYGKLADFMAVLEQKINSRVTLEDAETDADESNLNFVLELELAAKP